MSKEHDEMIAAMRTIMEAGLRAAEKGGFVCGIGFISGSGVDLRHAQGVAHKVIDVQESLDKCNELPGNIIDRLRAIPSSTAIKRRTVRGVKK